MCFELDSSPPIPAISGAAVSHEELELEAADGNRLAAFAALPDEPKAAGVVVLPDVRGLYRFYEEVPRACRARHTAIASTTSGGRRGPRSAATTSSTRPSTDEAETVQADVGAAVERLRGRECGTSHARFAGGTTSYCRRERARARGAIGLRHAGRATAARGRSSAAEIKAPVLAPGRDDQTSLPELNPPLDQALQAAGVEHEVVTYEGGRTASSTASRSDYADASDDAWRRVPTPEARSG
jgi:carboxymethylenebutenolidase